MFHLFNFACRIFIKTENIAIVAASPAQATAAAAAKGKDRMNGERDRERESSVVPYRVRDAIVVVVVVVVNKSKVGISLCQPKSRQRIWQRPQPHALRRVASARLAWQQQRRS